MHKAITFISCALSAAAGAIGVHIYWKDRHKKEMNELRKELNDIYHEKLTAETERVADETREAVSKEYEKHESPKKEKTELEKEVEEENITILKPEEYGDDPDFARFQYRYYPDNECFVNTDYDLPIDDAEIFDLAGRDIKERLDESDEVFVRNWDLKTDIAIYRGEGSFDLD